MPVHKSGLTVREGLADRKRLVNWTINGVFRREKYSCIYQPPTLLRCGFTPPDWVGGMVHQEHLRRKTVARVRDSDNCLTSILDQRGEAE